MEHHATDRPGQRSSDSRGRISAEDDRVKTLHRFAPLAVALALGACAELAPLRRPPLDPAADLTAVNTREEAIQRFGPPDEIRSSDLGPVLVYRRVVVVDTNPNRYYGEDRGNRLDQYELVLLYVDAEGRIVRRAIEPE
jgi:hypothetical protein